MSGWSPKGVTLAIKLLSPLNTILVSQVLEMLNCNCSDDDNKRKDERRDNRAALVFSHPHFGYHYMEPVNPDQFIANHQKSFPSYKESFNEYDFCIRCLPDQAISGIAFEIFVALNLIHDFKIRRSVLVKFILEIKQGYRPLPYHNWNHAVSVAHFIYLLIKKLKVVETGKMSKLDTFALIVSALAHDIDHRGTNNQFQLYSQSEIYNLYAYDGSFMERHHLSIALSILQKEECNILASLNESDRKYFVEILTWNIIATDTNKHLSTRQRLFREAKSTNPRERKLATLSLFMTCADLCDNCKKWNDNLPTVKGILSEYFSQGDKEKSMGLTPTPMMDRQVAYIPLIEYKFIKYMVAPVYLYLSGLYEELIPCITNILYNEKLWALTTKVFDDNAGSVDKLDILDLPAMREESLLRLKLDQTIEEITKRRFSCPLPPPPSSIQVEKDKKSDDDVDEEENGVSWLCCCCNKKS